MGTKIAIQIAESSVPIVPSNPDAMANPIKPLWRNDPWITDDAEAASNLNKKQIIIDIRIIAVRATTKVIMIGATTSPDKDVLAINLNNSAGNNIQ